ncbi:Os01g0543050 [Oryza sativa Japonica Group]|uniref:Os01g0543050 protein n=1 Tax=Oryza sativa subsp. japonica TaxID=39947 RepID=A0A0P0V3Q9_ORYSJ|nr:Os01g0543050 [Oryza sativa Japonica Group]
MASLAMEEEEEEEEAEGWQEKEVVVVMKDISGAHREIRLCLLDEYESEELGTSHCANPVENLEALSMDCACKLHDLLLPSMAADNGVNGV